MPRLSTTVTLSLFALLLVVSLPACSESSAEGTKPPVLATTASTETDKPANSDPFAVPDGDANELLAFIDQLSQFRPKSQEEADLYSEKAPSAMSAAAKKIMAMVPDPRAEAHISAACVEVDIRVGSISKLTAEERQQAAADVLSIVRAASKVSAEETSYHNERLMYLIMELRSADELKLAAKTLDEAADIFVSTGDPQLAAVADQLKSQGRMIVIPVATEEEQREIYEETRKQIANVEGDKLGETEFNIIRILLQELEDSTNKKLTREAYGAFADILRESGQSQLSADAAYFETLSQPIDIGGSTFQGKEFDWKSRRGKVVLVNFWATWCVPCVEKIPLLREMQEKYGDRGFEIVGISLDEDKANLTEFMATRGVPWTVLHHPGGQHPTAMQYHVESLPYTLLVDQDGYVISRNPTMAELTATLDEMFGKPLPAAKEQPSN